MIINIKFTISQKSSKLNYTRNIFKNVLWDGKQSVGIDGTILYYFHFESNN